MDKVRILRIVEYEGDREWVENTVKKSIHGEHQITKNRIIRATTLGLYPEIIKKKKGTKPCIESK